MIETIRGVSLRFIRRPFILIGCYLGAVIILRFNIGKNGRQFFSLIILIIIVGALAVYFLISLITYFNMKETESSALGMVKNLAQPKSKILGISILRIAISYIRRSFTICGFNVANSLSTIRITNIEINFFGKLYKIIFLENGGLIVGLRRLIFRILVGLNIIFKKH